MAIGIKVKKAQAGYDPGASKFFGTPTVPMGWEADFYEDEIFLCQIRLAEIAPLDKENKLPHRGYLYVFLHTEGGVLRPDVRYYDGEPMVAIDDFNAGVAGYERFNEAWLMSFEEVDDTADGTRLLGEPTDWSYGIKPPELLMQYDPLDNETGFLEEMDGWLYLFFGEDTQDFGAVTLHREYS